MSKSPRQSLQYCQFLLLFPLDIIQFTDISSGQMREFTASPVLARVEIPPGIDEIYQGEVCTGQAAPGLV